MIFDEFSKWPRFTVTVVLMLALSIGANTAIFSIVNALLLKSVPYPQAEPMATIYTRATSGGVVDFQGNWW